VVGEDQANAPLPDVASHSSRHRTGKGVQVDDIRTFLVQDAGEAASGDFITIAIDAVEIVGRRDSESPHR
jgi:hypothetical protein